MNEMKVDELKIEALATEGNRVDTKQFKQFTVGTVGWEQMRGLSRPQATKRCLPRSKYPTFGSVSQHM